MGEKKTYKIRITREKDSSECFVSCALTNAKDGGAAKRVAFASWDDLRLMLSSVHCGDDELADAERSLDDNGVALLAEVSLYDDQLNRLGFDVADCK